MRFASLGSGSRGNATLVSSAGTTLLIDCGFGMREAIRRMQTLHLDPATLAGILVTHEHIDHVRGVSALARRFGLTVYMTVGSWLSLQPDPRIDVVLVTPEETWSIGNLDITPVTVPHDAREPVQYLIEADRYRLGILTDLGMVTPHVLKRYRQCDALFIECNHDVRMLDYGPYPPSLKRRVSGRLGHLSNRQAAELLQTLGTDRLQRLVASHLSEKNNLPELAFEALSPLLDGDESRLVIAQQGRTVDWQSVS
ncbi:MBL fold metallo-hydrolase [Kushneria pakistanensis]|uniref:MBL fold metallo-hydrolase n=1 Tax=Kushneria pakistanensis TaxID=1508770 RepID=A0ABQ3FAQ8_9GAMM|nr:MBL fold metallo-hydrolase [Kushneria pakistanensis]GHC15983.1 MBL fold metallo-hydrolase [Kushneria pakistanensis]